MERLGAEISHDRGEIAGPEPGIHLGDLGREFPGIALAQAAEYDEPAALSPFLGLHGLEDGCDRLFLGITYEAAGVDEEIVGIAGIDDLIPVGRQLRQDMLGVDGILGASESYYPYGRHYSPAAAFASASLSSSVTNSRDAYFASSLYQSTTFFMCET